MANDIVFVLQRPPTQWQSSLKVPILSGYCGNVKIQIQISEKPQEVVMQRQGQIKSVNLIFDKKIIYKLFTIFLVKYYKLRSMQPTIHAGAKRAGIDMTDVRVTFHIDSCVQLVHLKIVT